MQHTLSTFWLISNFSNYILVFMWIIAPPSTLLYKHQFSVISLLIIFSVKWFCLYIYILGTYWASIQASKTLLILIGTYVYQAIYRICIEKRKPGLVFVFASFCTVLPVIIIMWVFYVFNSLHHISIQNNMKFPSKHATYTKLCFNSKYIRWGKMTESFF